MIVKPYGERDPYASIELIAYTKIGNDKYETDQMPVLSARVSHSDSGKTGKDRNADIKLMKYLAKHKHLSPFEHQSATFRIVAPLFVIREWERHRTQSFNETSMRYSSDPVGKFHIPEGWRKQETRNKQSSAGELDKLHSDMAYEVLETTYNTCLASYNELLSLGVCREQARMVVPVGNYTELYVTANLRNWYNFWVLRSHETAQLEIRKYSDAISDMLQKLWPESWSALKENK